MHRRLSFSFSFVVAQVDALYAPLWGGNERGLLKASSLLPLWGGKVRKRELVRKMMIELATHVYTHSSLTY